MNVWHFDAAGQGDAVDGVTNGLWALAEDQLQAGLAPVVFVRSSARPERLARTARPHATVSVRSFDPRLPALLRWLRTLTTDLPDVVHLHGSWVVRHALIGRWCQRRSIPYVLTPHGGLARPLLQRRPRLRRLYLRQIESPLVRGARRVLFLIAAEQDEAELLLGSPIEGAALAVFPLGGGPARDDSMHPDPEVPHTDPSLPPTVVFHGRYDVFQKGLDRLVALAAAAPDLRFACYGSPTDGGSARQAFDVLLAGRPSNVEFHSPVHGSEKDMMLRSATAYVLTSRFEGFPLSVAEAMLAGLPVFCAGDLPLAGELVAAGAGVALPTDPQQAAAVLVGTVDDAEAMEQLGAAAARYAARRFSPMTLGDEYARIYTEATDREVVAA